MKKLFKFGPQAKASLLRGVQLLADSVGTTLGPLGNNVAIGVKWSYPQVIHDGVTVAKAVELEDPFENVGAQIVKEAASKTNDSAGDGTTTSTLLSYAMISEGLRSIDNGVNPMKLRTGINYAVEEVITYIKSKSRKISTLEEITQVATISAQDKEIGKLVAKALKKVGVDGVVTVQDGNTNKIEVSYKEGMQFDKGYFSPYFAKDKRKAVVDNPKILVTDHNISSAMEIMSLLEMVLSETKSFVIISPLVDGDALSTLVGNTVKGFVDGLAIKAPGFGDNTEEMLRDIASLTGATFIDKKVRKLSSVTMADLGSASKIEATEETSSIVGGIGDVKGRVKEIKEEIGHSTSEFDTERLRTRLAKLTSGAAVISVGASTEVEMKEKKERVIDAVGATKSALSEGVIAGGGVMLIRASEHIKPKEGCEDGIRVVQSALKKPFNKLMENAGLDYLESLQKVREGKENEGINVYTGELVDLVEEGVIDPVKVVRFALESAKSVAGSILTTNVIIVDKEEDKDAEES